MAPSRSDFCNIRDRRHVLPNCSYVERQYQQSKLRSGWTTKKACHWTAGKPTSSACRQLRGQGRDVGENRQSTFVSTEDEDGRMHECFKREERSLSNDVGPGEAREREVAQSLYGSALFSDRLATFHNACESLSKSNPKEKMRYFLCSCASSASSPKLRGANSALLHQDMMATRLKQGDLRYSRSMTP
jgi:hypothetical protein